MSREFSWREEALPTVTWTMTVSGAWMEPTLVRHSRKVMGVGAERDSHTLERRQRKYHTMGNLHPGRRREDVS